MERDLSLENRLNTLGPNKRRVYDAFVQRPGAVSAEVAAALELSLGTVQTYRSKLRSAGFLPNADAFSVAGKYSGVAIAIKEGCSVKQIMERYNIRKSGTVFAIADSIGLPIGYIGNKTKIEEYFNTYSTQQAV